MYHEVMSGFILRVKAYVSEPKQLDALIFARESITVSAPIVTTLPRFLNGKGYHEVTEVVSHFEEEYACKVNFSASESIEEGAWVYEFDIFEQPFLGTGIALTLTTVLRNRLCTYINSKTLS